MEKEVSEFKSALNRLAKTADGKLVLQYIKKESKYDTYIGLTKTTAGECDPYMCTYFEGRRAIYAKLRGLLSVENLVDIERG